MSTSTRVARIIASAGIIVIAAAMGGCSSSAKHVSPPVPPTSAPTTVAPHPSRDALEFRVVKGSLPYKTIPGSPPGAPTSCEDGKLVTPSTSDAATRPVVLADRQKTACYSLGPVVLTGHNIDRAQAVVNDSTAQWEVDIHFANNDFVAKVANRYTNEQIAIILDHVVESAPTIDAGITGQDITISGSFDKATAHAIAKKLS